MILETKANNSERFEAAFNRIHKRLQQLIPYVDSSKFSLLVREGAKRHALVRAYAEDLYQFAKLRNAIVHERIDIDYYIAEPHDKVILRLEEIDVCFHKPLYALQIATRPVLYFYENTGLPEILQSIDKYAFSQFPVYDIHGAYSWLLTSNGIIHWMAKHFLNGSINLEAAQASHLKDAEQVHHVLFVPKSATIFDVEEYFEQSHLQGGKLEACIITENGKMMEIPLGIVTSWDLVEIDLLK